MSEDVERNYVAEMRAIVDAETGMGDYVPRLLAAQIVEKVQANDPELLFNWLFAQAESLVWQAINSRDQSRRARARRVAGSERFARAVADAEGGDLEPLGKFLDLRYTVGDGSRRRLADLGARELQFVADGYARRADENKMNAAFLRALATKVGQDKVSDHFTDADLNAMWSSLNRS